MPPKRIPQLARRLAAAAMLLVLAACASSPTPPPAGPVTPAATQQPVSLHKRAPILGLALGGGAARGFAHIGVIQVLEEAGIKPDLVVGTSAGSLVAAVYASGKTGAQLQQLASSMEEAAITDWRLPIFGRGVLRGEALARYVEEQVGNKPLESMPIPLGIVATNLHNGNGILFRRGSVATAVRASSAVPAIFEPVKIGDQEYVDGGLVAPVPVDYARQMGAEVVLAVDISSPPEGKPVSSTFDVFMQTFAIMSKSINHFELKQADVVLRPDLHAVSSADFAARMQAIEAGRVAMRAALPQLRKVLEASRKDVP